MRELSCYMIGGYYVVHDDQKQTKDFVTLLDANDGVVARFRLSEMAELLIRRGYTVTAPEGGE